MSTKFKIKWKAFWLAFVPIFILVVLQQLGVQFPKFFPQKVSQQPQQSVIKNEKKVLPKLNLYPTNYKLKNTSYIVKNAFASSSYENLSSYAVVDFETGEVLAQKNISKRVPIASLTKIMTAVVALDLANSSDEFEVSETASKIIPTIIGVVPSQKLTLSELLHGLLMTSANDAAEVIKEGIDNKYQEKIFINAMNVKARNLNLSNTHFSNPQGFDSKYNYSSAEDLALLTHYALTNYPLIAEIVKKDYLFLSESQKHKQFDLYNWNGLLGVYPNVMGVKIGNTPNAGHTTVVLSKREDKTILVVVLGAPGGLERDLWASQLLDVGFEKTLNLKPFNVTIEELQQKYSTWKYWG